MRKRLSLVAGIVVTMIVAILFVYGGVNLGEFTTQLAVGLTLLLPAIAYFAFKPKINKLIKSEIRKIENIPQIAHNIQQQETKTNSQPVQPIIKSGIRHYENRSQLPFGEVISKAEQNVEMSAITFRILTLSYHHILRGILSRRVHITFLLLKPDSSSISVQRKIYYAADDLEEQIRGSLKILCNLKKEFNDLVEIRLYNSLSEHSIIIIDRNDPDKAWIKVESRPVGSDSNSRPNDVAYHKDNQAFFDLHCSEYDTLLKNSEPCECPY
jgi:hypothetical protein